MEVGSCNDAEIQAVLSALWSAADVHGCFGLRDVNLRNRIPCPARLDHWPSSDTSLVRSAC